MKVIKYLVLSFVFLPMLLLGFQNCGSKTFDYDEYGAFLKQCDKDATSSEECPNWMKENFNKSFAAAPTDILFILDESCSMNTIADNVRSGLVTLSSGNFPSNTKMAVTYMSPVKVENGIPNFSVPYMTGRVETSFPGHMKLVTKQTIDSYVSTHSFHNSFFPIDGCTQDWFSPTDKDSGNKKCIEATSQLIPSGDYDGDGIADWCTGVEAGLVSLEQLLAKYNLQKKKLFRSGSKVNIVLISDTHEPGIAYSQANPTQAYFGMSGAYPRQKTLEEIQALIRANTPDVASVKISGILPLPVVGHPIYSGLKTTGALPQNDAEAKVNSELTFDYSYLPFIKATNGIVSHAKSTNWSGVASSIINDAKSTGNIYLTLSKSARKILSVKINGSNIDLSKVTINSDLVSITINYSNNSNEALDIEVEYQSLF